MDFKGYFQDELNYLRDVGDEFARLNPKLVRYLSRRNTDPDVERLLEGFAFLTARLRQKLDSEVPEVTDPVLEIVCPNMIRPIPPVTMMKFTPRDRSFTTRQVVERGVAIRPEAEGSSTCIFTTTADCPVYPLEMGGVEVERNRDTASLRLTFRTLNGLPVNSIGLRDLRLWFHGRDADMLYLYCFEALKVLRLTGGGSPIRLPREIILPGGFGPNEALLPGLRPDLDGHRLMQEYFACREKLSCIDLEGLGRFVSPRNGETFSIEFEFDRPLPPDIRPDGDSIRLHCVPAVNLVRHRAAPFDKKPAGTLHPVIPVATGPSRLAVFSVERVGTWREETGLTEDAIPPFAELVPPCRKPGRQKAGLLPAPQGSASSRPRSRSRTVLRARRRHASRSAFAADGRTDVLQRR